MRIRDIFTCWDFLVAITISLILWYYLPNQISISFAKDIYYLGVSILSKIFTIYFASLAIIISTSDNDFICFLEEDGHYTALLKSFKYSLLMIFFALMFSLFLYVLTSYFMNKYSLHPKHIFIPYIFLFLYSLFTVFNASLDAMKYLNYRLQYNIVKKQKE